MDTDSAQQLAQRAFVKYQKDSPRVPPIIMVDVVDDFDVRVSSRSATDSQTPEWLKSWSQHNAGTLALVRCGRDSIHWYKFAEERTY